MAAVASPDFFADFRFLLILDFWFGLSVKDVLSCVCVTMTLKVKIIRSSAI